jgi:flagellar L-ring protein FlgH
VKRKSEGGTVARSLARFEENTAATAETGQLRGRTHGVADVVLPALRLPSIVLLLSSIVMGLPVLLLTASGQASAQGFSPADGSSAGGAGGQAGNAAKPAARRSLFASTNLASASLASYLARVRAETTSALPSQGAIWTDTGRLTRMTTDVRAMRPNDLISVVVEENLAASTDGTVKNQRASAANSGISGLLGTLHAGNALQNLITQSSTNSLNAQGASATNSSLSTTFGGQVIDVLPNGMLVIEAARQVEFSQQTQTIVLRGLVRPEDISQQNQVLSTAISSLELEVKGKGIVNDYTRRQNPLVRWLQQILVF